MAIKKWILTGDTHGDVATRLGNIKRNIDCGLEKETAIIILGDAGLNFYLNKTDIKKKKQIDKPVLFKTKISSVVKKIIKRRKKIAKS